jgi:hypothetical protein
MLTTTGESGVTVKRDTLLAALKKNREEHRKTFLEAQEGFRAMVIEKLDAMLKDARDRKPITLRIDLPAPTDQTRDYDRVIRMLEMSINEEILISEQEFSQYVMDDWGWKAQWVGTTSNYTNKR